MKQAVSIMLKSGRNWEKLLCQSFPWNKLSPQFSDWLSTNLRVSETKKKSLWSKWSDATSLKLLKRNRIINFLSINGMLIIVNRMTMKTNLWFNSLGDNNSLKNVEVLISLSPFLVKILETESSCWIKFYYWESLTYSEETKFAKILF